MKQQIELFVVVVTVAILAGMLLPALNQAKEKARQADCTSHLSQIGKGSFQYAMCYDDWYPTSSNKISAPKWMDGNSGVSFDLLRKVDLITDPTIFVCPSKKEIAAAEFGSSLKGHVSYNWCDGLIGGNCTMSPIACDGVDNHQNSGRFLRGDGSVGYAQGSSSQIWTYDRNFRDFCYKKTYTDYSF